MKTFKIKTLLLLVLLTPFLLLAQEGVSAMQAVNNNSGLMSQLAQLLPMGINPYATVFFTSILSKSGMHNDFVATNPFFDSWIIIVLFGALFLFTTLVGTVFKTNKATAVVGLADNYLSNHAAILINVIVMLAPSLISSGVEQTTIQEAGFLTVGLKTILVLIVSVYFLVVVTTVRFFIDILIFLTPIPFIDSILEIVKVVITILFIFVSVFYPTFSVILSVIVFLVALTMYKKSLRLVSKTTYLFIYPIMNMFKDKEKLLTKNDGFSMLVYVNKKTKLLKKGVIARLEEREDGFYLVKRRFFISKKEEKVDFSDSFITQGSLKSKITSDTIDLTLFLNRSYYKHIQEITNKLGINNNLEEDVLVLNSGNGVIGKIKNMFSKSDVEELKLIE